MNASTIIRCAGSLPRGPIAAVGIAAALAFGLGFVAATRSVDSNQELASSVLVQDQMDQEAMMEAWMESMQPGEQHEAMDAMVGTWKAELKSMMAPMESVGTATFTRGMNGKFVRQDFNSNMMGIPMHGISFTGYNKVLDRYESVWFDDMNTAMSFMTGKKTENGWEYHGEETDPMTGNTLDIRDLLIVHGEDHFTFTRQYPAQAMKAQGMPVPEGAEWVDGFQVSYTRAEGDHDHDHDHDGNSGGNSHR
ncbi:MAG: DUF1579 family protein [Phycisphaerales bacterium]|nr:DUF1579 family protein [Phycisphaerales bacterium]